MRFGLDVQTIEETNMSKPEIQKVPATDDRSLPVFAEFDEIADRIRQRAFDLFSLRGHQHGSTLDDWLAAEREICWPATELKETGKAFKLKVALAGFDGDDITVTASPDELIVKASHGNGREEADDGDEENVRWSEFRSAEVFRHIVLPHRIDVDSVTAEFKHGMLKIAAKKAPLPEKDTPKSVTVQTAA